MMTASPSSSPAPPTSPALEMPAQYDAATTEREVARRWRGADAFAAQDSGSTRVGGHHDPFVIFMPPPNVTAVLHVGHGLTMTVQDVIIRWRRMAGDDTLYQPGTDHAGIATQHIVEKMLAAEGTTRRALGRDTFVARTAEFVAQTGGTIIEQLRAIGVSADWSRTAYTFSPALSRAVREAFVRLYEEGLIYRGHRVIHWCPRCLTSLSDEEAEHEDESGALYHVRYPVAGDPGRAVVVATTRPETMLGDVAIAVHPDDARYQPLVGQRVVLPIVGIEIPIVADAAVDPAFGTGAVKITPAHDANDFEIGRRHALPMPVVINPAAEMEAGADAAGRVPTALAGLDRFDARARIVEMLRASGALVRVEDHRHAVRHCYRCNAVVEPRLSDQWFVRMAPLAAPALDAVRSGTVRILPDRWVAVYVNWMENIRDWNISRQLWWGHRIPVWYCDACGWQAALRDDPPACPTCAGALRQDEDVLDTWFSSWLWPLSTLGWPDDTPARRAFYPGDVLVTGPDILFFWVARMIMSGLHFDGRAPFHTVLLNGIVRDTQHRKMSKSLGNGIDPVDVVTLYGADALRYTQIAGMGLGTDVILDPENLERSFAPGRNFVTKLWNIGRFLLTNVGDEIPAAGIGDLAGASALTRADLWILARLDTAIAACDAALGPARPDATGRWTGTDLATGLRLSEFVEAARAFVWSDLADWYLEHCKGRLAPEWDAHDRAVARAVLLHVFDAALRLMHPVVPFVTEALWQLLPTTDPDALLIRAAWPIVRDLPTQLIGRRSGATRLSAHTAAAEYDLVREAASAVRQIRADYGVPPGTVVEAVIEPAPASRAVFVEEATALGRLSRSEARVAAPAGTAPAGTALAAPDRGAAATAVLTDGTTVIIPLAGLIDVAKECARLRGELTRLDSQLAALRGRLANPGFLSRAPEQVVEGERTKEREWATRADLLRARVQGLCPT
jgi:valyl-tRNA synthetase